ncbi:protein of unknown function [Burkholderia multivorans]
MPMALGTPSPDLKAGKGVPRFYVTHDGAFDVAPVTRGGRPRKWEAFSSSDLIFARSCVPLDPLAVMKLAC